MVFVVVGAATGCTLSGEREGDCGGLTVTLDLTQTETRSRDGEDGWSGELRMDGEAYEAFGGRSESRDWAVVVPDASGEDSALVFRGDIDLDGFHGLCGPAAFSRDERASGVDVVLCIFSLGTYCRGERESAAEAASAMIWDAGELDLADEFTLRPVAPTPR